MGEIKRADEKVLQAELIGGEIVVTDKESDLSPEMRRVIGLKAKLKEAKKNMEGKEVFREDV